MVIDGHNFEEHWACPCGDVLIIVINPYPPFLALIIRFFSAFKSTYISVKPSIRTLNGVSSYALAPRHACSLIHCTYITFTVPVSPKTHVVGTYHL